MPHQAHEKLKKIADRMKSERDSGAMPVAELTTVRELLGWFNYSRRSDRLIRRIRTKIRGTRSPHGPRFRARAYRRRNLDRTGHEGDGCPERAGRSNRPYPRTSDSPLHTDQRAAEQPACQGDHAHVDQGFLTTPRDGKRTRSEGCGQLEVDRNGVHAGTPERRGPPLDGAPSGNRHQCSFVRCHQGHLGTWIRSGSRRRPDHLRNRDGK